MKIDKLKSLLITITSELRKLSKEELLHEAECVKGFSYIMRDANLLTSRETQFEYLCNKTTFTPFENYAPMDLALFGMGNGILAADNYDYAMAA